MSILISVVKVHSCTCAINYDTSYSVHIHTYIMFSLYTKLLLIIVDKFGCNIFIIVVPYVWCTLSYYATTYSSTLPLCL